MHNHLTRGHASNVSQSTYSDSAPPFSYAASFCYSVHAEPGAIPSILCPISRAKAVGLQKQFSAAGDADLIKNAKKDSF